MVVTPPKTLAAATFAPRATHAAHGSDDVPAARLFEEVQQALVELRACAQGAAPLPWGRLGQLVDRVIASLAGTGDLFWVANPVAAPDGCEYLAFHQARTCVVAIRLGAALGFSRERLHGLGLAACLMDIGLWLLPPDLLQRVDALTPEETSRYREHPRVAADLVARSSPPLAGLVEAVLDHHEREGGQGFPAGLAGPAIHPDARLLGLVDTYASLTVPPLPRRGLRAQEALRQIVRTRGEAFPAPLIKALLAEVSLFPPGTLVRLSSGEIGRVVAVNRQQPLRPRVRVHALRGERLASPREVDLADAPFLYITGPVVEPGP